MPMPPLNPLGNNNTYFELLCNSASEYLVYPISIDGYQETLDRYRDIESTDPENWELAKQLNSWSEYFSELANLIQKEYLDAEAEKLNVVSQKSINYSDKVSAGDRFANTELEVIRARKSRNALKSLYDALIAKTDFLEKAFYQCKAAAQLTEKEKP